MSDALRDVRDIYRKIPNEDTTSMSKSVPYLLRELGLTPCDESEGIESTRIVIDVQNISDTLTKWGYGNFEQTEEYDPKSTEIAKHIIGLLVRYPFLWHKKIDSRKASSEDLANIFTEQSCNPTCSTTFRVYMELPISKGSKYGVVCRRAFILMTR